MADSANPYDPTGHWRRLIGSAAVVLVAAFVAPRFVPAPDLEENRVLAGAPAPPKGLGDLTAYRHAVDAYVADRFPPRAQLIGALNRLRLLFGVSGSPRVVVGRDGWLFDDDGRHMAALTGDPPLSDADATAWLAGLAGRTEALAAHGRAYLVISPPMKAAVYPAQAPGWLHLDINRPAVTLSRLAKASGAGRVLYLDSALAGHTRYGLMTYTPYDTHWTGLGAYLGYAALMRELHAQGLAEAPRALEDFQEVRAGEANKPRNLALMLGVASFVHVDYPELADPADDDNLQIRYLTANHEWTGARTIDTAEPGKPVLLITVDSFSNALLPFLYSHFSRIVVAHIQDGAWRPDLIARFNPDIVITEVTESGLGSVMAASPAASPEALARIRATVARRARYELEVRTASKTTPYHHIDGTDGPDHLRGGPGRDDIKGKPGDDTIEGLGGDDVLRGGRGNDLVDGGDGDDWVSGDRGDDTLRGGRGADVFHSFIDAGTDTVLDFSIDEGDRVQLDPGTAYTALQEGSDTVVEMQGARLILKGIRMTDLPPGWIRIKRPPLASGP
ncbi:hypothetical protein [Phenylobacterium sp.]|uniref:alginate O-acetyltransferase AlgX-related protein n=1 Tax=Phenylobacterium sp. TaxID=1871053 RepID=UPI0025D4E089|nr:hypothetical protein [Phenylobacterium sp.]